MRATAAPARPISTSTGSDAATSTAAISSGVTTGSTTRVCRIDDGSFRRPRTAAGGECRGHAATVVAMPGSDHAPSTADAARVAEVAATAPDLVLPLPGNDPTPRRLAADLVGDPGAPAVLLVHGTPDSRLARHPDPAATVAAGVHLVAVDRPGFGHSTVDPDGDPTTFATDVVHLVDHLALDAVDVLAWSAGASWALAVGAVAPARGSGRSRSSVGWCPSRRSNRPPPTPRCAPPPETLAWAWSTPRPSWAPGSPQR